MSEQTSRESNENLIVKNLIVSRLSGIREGYRLKELSPGINLIHGPNGIGKSRTALALQLLIWPNLGTHQASLIGNMGVSGDTWNIELNLGKAAYQKNSAPVSSFIHAIPPESHHNRYLLTLQDLLRVENKTFALEIQNEASGGYDLGRVQSELKIPTAQKGFRPSKSVKPLQEARKKLHNLRQQEGQLRDQEASLGRLRTDHANAIAASNRLKELEAARAFQNTCDELKSARLALDSFPPLMSKMRGEEHEQAASLMQRLSKMREEHRTCNIKIATLEEELQSAGFIDNIPLNSVLTSLRHRLENLQRQEIELHQAESRVRELTNQLAVFRNRLNPAFSEEQMASLDETGLRKLAELSREWQQAHNTLQIQNDLAQWLGTPREWNRESLRNGVDLLS